MANSDLPNAIVQAGQYLREQVPDLATRLRADLTEVISELEGQHEVLIHLERSITANMEGFFDALSQGIDASDILPPPTAIFLPRYMAHVIDSPDVMLRIYYAGHSRIWLDWTMPAVVAAVQAHGGDLPSLLQYAYAEQYEYLYHAAERVSGEFHRERVRMENGRQLDASRIVADILTGQGVNDTSAERLRYNLAGKHIAIVCWAQSNTSLGEDTLERAARDLSRSISNAPALIIPGRVGEAWAWIPLNTSSSTVQQSKAALERVLRAVKLPVHVAVGKSASGVEGFRSSHNDALRTQRVVMGSGRAAPSVTEYQDVALISLLLSDRDAAMDFVKRRLGLLAATGTEYRTLRRTVLKFVQQRGSFSRAATELSVHRNTVLYRVQKAEEMLGAKVEDAGMDFYAALLLADWLETE